jgi:hypothetical protein
LPIHFRVGAQIGNHPPVGRIGFDLGIRELRTECFDDGVRKAIESLARGSTDGDRSGVVLHEHIEV